MLLKTSALRIAIPKNRIITVTEFVLYPFFSLSVEAKLLNSNLNMIVIKKLI